MCVCPCTHVYKKVFGGASYMNTSILCAMYNTIHTLPVAEYSKRKKYLPMEMLLCFEANVSVFKVKTPTQTKPTQ